MRLVTAELTGQTCTSSDGHGIQDAPYAHMSLEVSHKMLTRMVASSLLTPLGVAGKGLPCRATRFTQEVGPEVWDTAPAVSSWWW